MTTNNKEIDWSNVSYKNTPLFSLNGLETDAKVLKVYDGDTLYVAINFQNSLCKFKCRLSRIDTPELRTTDEVEKKYALESKQYLVNKVENKIVKLKVNNNDKYGRLLVDIFVDNVNINDLMIKEKYAIKYDGGKKIKFNEKDFQKIL